MALLHGLERTAGGALRVLEGLGGTLAFQRGYPISPDNDLAVTYSATPPAGSKTINGVCRAADGTIVVWDTTPGYVYQGVGYTSDAARVLCVVHSEPANGARRASMRCLGTSVFVNDLGQVHVNPADFMLRFTDSGSGAVLTTVAAGIGSATFTRATAASAKLSTGLWKLDVASGTARSHYIGMDTAVGAYGGYLAEGQRTNSCLQSRDITNAAWTKTTLTTAKTSTGIDGVTNSCTRCTAAGANSTALQAITLASAAKTFSIWIKRVTGTGNIFITLDNDATRTDVTALINSATFTLVQMTQTLANPNVGFKIATNGDAIDVDVTQLEDVATFASTPIPTTTIAVTRNTDLLTYQTSGNLSSTQGSAILEFTTRSVGSVFTEIISTGAAGGGIPFEIDGTGFLDIFDGTARRASTLSPTRPSIAIQKAAISWTGTTATAFLAGASSAMAGYDGSLDLAATIAIGNHATGGGGSELFGTIKNLRLYLRALSGSALQALTA